MTSYTTESPEPPDPDSLPDDAQTEANVPVTPPADDESPTKADTADSEDDDNR